VRGPQAAQAAGYDKEPPTFFTTPGAALQRVKIDGRQLLTQQSAQGTAVSTRNQPRHKTVVLDRLVTCGT